MDKGGIARVAIAPEEKIRTLDKKVDLYFFFIEIFVILSFQKMRFIESSYFN